MDEENKHLYTKNHIRSSKWLQIDTPNWAAKQMQVLCKQGSKHYYTPATISSFIRSASRWSMEQAVQWAVKYYNTSDLLEE